MMAGGMGGQLPPHSLEAEQAVLAAVLAAPGEALALLQQERVGADWFYDVRHQVVMAAVLEMDRRAVPIDAINLLDAVRSLGKEEAVGGMAYLSELAGVFVSMAMVPGYVETLREKWLARRAIRICTESAGALFDPTANVSGEVDRLERELLGLSEERFVGRDLKAKELVLRLTDVMDNYVRGVGIRSGLRTGFDYMDKMTTGFHPGNLVVIAGRPGAGKTSFAMNVAEFLAVSEKVPVGVFSLEMTGDELMSRLAFQRAKADYQRFRTGFGDSGELPRIALAMHDIALAPLVVDESSGSNIMQIRATTRRWVRQYGVKLIAIDYLQLMRPAGRFSTREQEVAEISNGLKSLAKELQIVVVALAQMNREIDKDKRGAGDQRYHRKPELSDLRESGQLEQDADLVLMFYQPKLRDYEEEQKNSVDWSKRFVRINGLVAKQRNGPTGDVEFLFWKQCMRFEPYVRPARERANVTGDDED